MDPEYFDGVERAFLLHTGGLMLSPTDARLIAGWARAGIPIDTVQQGITAGFERDRARPVRQLADLRVDVEKAIKRWQTRRVGQQATHAQSLGTVFDALRDQFAARADDRDAVVQQLVREATASLNGFAELARSAAVPDPVELLDSLGAQLAASAVRHASAAVAAELKRSAPADRLWRAVRAHYQLPPLVIDLGGGW